MYNSYSINIESFIMHKNYAFNYNGDVWYTMAGLSVAFNLHGYVIRKKDGREVHEDPQGQYSVKIDGYPCKKSFKLLYLAVLAPEIKANRGYTLCLYNPDKPYRPRNLYLKTNRGGKDLEKTTELNRADLPSVDYCVPNGVKIGDYLSGIPEEQAYEDLENISADSSGESNKLTLDAMNEPEMETLTLFDSPVEAQKRYYQVVTDSTTYITEDGAKFPNKQLADWHQDKVSKGKGNAQIVRDFNGGWQLAEEIFLQEVHYNTGKPYENFIDVMQNNSGIVVQEPVAMFTPESLVEALRNDIRVAGLCLFGRKFTTSQAENINQLLLKYVSERDALKETYSSLFDLCRRE